MKRKFRCSPLVVLFLVTIAIIIVIGYLSLRISKSTMNSVSSPFPSIAPTLPQQNKIWSKTEAYEKCRELGVDEGDTSNLPKGFEQGDFFIMKARDGGSLISPDCLYKILPIGYFSEQGEYNIDLSKVGGIWLLNNKTKYLRRLVNSEDFAEFVGWIGENNFVFNGKDLETGEKWVEMTFNILSNKTSRFYFPR